MKEKQQKTNLKAYANTWTQAPVPAYKQEYTLVKKKKKKKKKKQQLQRQLMH